MQKVASVPSTVPLEVERVLLPSNVAFRTRGGTSLEKVGWPRCKIDCQKVYLMFFMLFLL